MKIKLLISLMIIVGMNHHGQSQFLSNLKATRHDALFTTYAAPPERSNYKTDQGYQFQWFDEEAGVEFVSKDGPNMGIAFQMGKRVLYRLQELYREPVVTASYSDLIKYYYYPVKDLRVEVFFAAYSSETALERYRFVNETQFPVSFTILPYLYYPSADSVNDIERRDNPDGFIFPLQKQRDGWMKEHNIPVTDTLTGYWTLTGFTAATESTFVRKTSNDKINSEKEQLDDLIFSIVGQKRVAQYIKGFISARDFTLQPGDATEFTIKVDLTKKQTPGSVKSRNICTLPTNFDQESLVRADEKAYSKIPKLNFKDRDQEMLYWSAFSLMRQCIMPPEGECNYNYYVFSREPKWGWGYGGQVFHESLAMMAYVYMDPAGAMNSQRVYMERQRSDGYINYRTGPYLNETIITNDKPTSSAPWFNYENLEIFKITGDRTFLKDAYQSGKKFYQYYVANRDSNSNGLCEWGAHAELESVRDARVAVWDKVGWASNFEGPDVNSALVMEARSLAEMAQLLGFGTESQRWKEDAAKRSLLINKTMWDPETKFYYNVNRNNQSFTFLTNNDLKIKEIIGFLPLWAGVADAKMAGSLVEKMTDTTEFWRRYGIPSLTAVSDYYNPIGYWNGPVWVQWNYLLYRGLRDFGYNDVAKQLSNRVLDNMIYHLKNDHVFWEFYSADDRQAGWNKTYIWAGIASRFLIDEMSNEVAK
ncbi:MAG: trehalase family glycosidase [Bacteroidetes bacterium]|nr:trehalase family glycosidase [Bacteroidota bacterium]